MKVKVNNTLDQVGNNENLNLSRKKMRKGRYKKIKMKIIRMSL